MFKYKGCLENNPTRGHWFIIPEGLKDDVTAGGDPGMLLHLKTPNHNHMNIQSFQSLDLHMTWNIDEKCDTETEYCLCQLHSLIRIIIILSIETGN